MKNKMDKSILMTHDGEFNHPSCHVLTLLHLLDHTYVHVLTHTHFFFFFYLGYLKLFQLSGENFASSQHWDVVLIDETQDLSPTIIDLVKKATSCAKIIVGDPNQQIYSFRGVTNAIPMIEADRTFYLTRVGLESSIQDMTDFIVIFFFTSVL